VYVQEGHFEQKVKNVQNVHEKRITGHKPGLSTLVKNINLKAAGEPLLDIPHRDERECGRFNPGIGRFNQEVLVRNVRNRRPGAQGCTLLTFTTFIDLNHRVKPRNVTLSERFKPGFKGERGAGQQ